MILPVMILLTHCCFSFHVVKLLAKTFLMANLENYINKILVWSGLTCQLLRRFHQIDQFRS